MLHDEQTPDRRSHLRAPLSVPVLLDSAVARGQGQAADVSGGGVRVASDWSAPLGTVVELYFELPNRMAIEARARVVRCEPGLVALAFTEIDAACHLALRSYCRLALIRNRPGAPRPYRGVTASNRV